MRLFDWESGKEKQTLKLGDNTEVYCHEVQFHPQGFWIGAISGQPGKGKFFLLRTGEDKPFFENRLANCHSLGLHPGGTRFAVISNAGLERPARRPGERRCLSREYVADQSMGFADFDRLIPCPLVSRVAAWKNVG